jgi:hypothetical protein
MQNYIEEKKVIGLDKTVYVFFIQSKKEYCLVSDNKDGSKLYKLNTNKLYTDEEITNLDVDALID